jgi:uncharacterized membrane protein YuzA (DUF378 family)
MYTFDPFCQNNKEKLRRYYMSTLQKIALVIVIIGALNWGLLGLFGFNLVSFLFDGYSTVISRIIYAIVGVAGIISIAALATTDRREHVTHH